MLKRMFHTAGSGLHVFNAAIGPIGLAWTPQGVCAVEFGHADIDAVSAVLARKRPGLKPVRPLPVAVKRLAGRMKAHLGGKADEFRDVPLDFGGASEFSVRVWNELRKVGSGTVVTYGDLARRAGKPQAARAVGRIMGANPVPLIVPCHRCLGADGSLTGFSSEGGVMLKKRLLFLEGYEPDAGHAAGLRHLRRVDPVMRGLIRRIGPYQALPDKPAPPYDTLVTAIVHQQLSVKAGRTIAGRVRDLTPGPRYPGPAEMLAMPDQTLRTCGLSGQKTSYVKDLATRVLDGRLKLNGLRRLDDETAIAALCTVKGIGEWSAHMHLIFHLGRLDVLPVGDLGIQMAAARAYGLGEYATKAQLEELGEKWRPYRSMAAWYLWRGLDSGGI